MSAYRSCFMTLLLLLFVEKKNQIVSKPKSTKNKFTLDQKKSEKRIFKHVCLSVCAPLCFSMDNVHVVRQQERNSSLDIEDFYLFEHEDGEIEFSSSMNLERVTRLIKARVMGRDSLVTLTWLPSKPPPPLACSLKRILALPDKLKLTATAYMKCNIMHC